MRKKNKELINKIRLVLQWLNDLDSAEMIETKNYQRTYMSFDDGVSMDDSISICVSVNALLTILDHPRRITQYMGEIVPRFA